MGRSSKRRPTIKDVAAVANLSTATVSHVLNDTRYVSDESRKKVNEAIKMLGYYPNQLVGSMRRNRSYTVGLVLPCISNETMGSIADQLQRGLLKHQESLIICNTSYDSELEALEISNLIKQRVDAIISFPTSDDPTLLQEAKNQGIPIILVDRQIDALEADTVLLDNYTATKGAVEYLISLGHRQIGYIDRKKSQSHSNDQRKGYCDALLEHGIDQTYIVTAQGYDYNAGLEAASTIIREHPEITACIAYYDVIAMGAIKGFAEMGRKTPEDVSVIGYDSMPFSHFTSPTISSVVFPVKEVAEEVCRITMQRILENRAHNTKFTSLETVKLSPQFFVGESTKRIKE